MPTRSSYDDPRWRRVDGALAVVLLLFFGYTVLEWRGIIGDGTAWRPGQMVLASGGLLMLGLAPLVQRRSLIASFGLLAGALVILYLRIAAR